jgi:hypothetical protein
MVYFQGAMAKPTKPTNPEPAAQEDWDGLFDGPEAPDAPAGDTMPKRARGLPTQNGGAMRSVFAYLLDEDAPPPPPSPPPKRRK